MLSLLEFKERNKNTKIFALIGSPVDKSVGDVFHNRYFQDHQIEARYFKWMVEKEDLQEALCFLKTQVSGLSVTMPLKEAILPYVDKPDALVEKIGALNTLVIQDHLWKGTNTDGLGAMNAFGSSIQNKKLALLGAGGSARALAHAAVERGALVWIFNRCKEKAQRISKGLGAQGGLGFQERPPVDFDVFVNTLPFGVALEEGFFMEQRVWGKEQRIVDITHTQEESWLFPVACRCGFLFMDRRPLFLEQALLQQAYWRSSFGL